MKTLSEAERQLRAASSVSDRTTWLMAALLRLADDHQRSEEEKEEEEGANSTVERSVQQQQQQQQTAMADSDVEDLNCRNKPELDETRNPMMTTMMMKEKFISAKRLDEIWCKAMERCSAPTALTSLLHSHAKLVSIAIAPEGI